MRVKVLFFGMLKDIVGTGEDQLTVAEGAQLKGIFEHYAGRFPRLSEMASSIVLARNHEFSDASTQVGEGDEVAFLPPVSGGTAAESNFSHEIQDEAGHFFALTRQPIDARALIEKTARGEDGAVVNFEGIVRNNSKGRETRFLEYECYEPMAIKTLAAIGREIAASHA